MVRRRVRREPVAYILGRKGFRRIEVVVDRRVLIPRPETELLVEVAVELGARIVLDVGTGSGAIALAIADEVPDASITAIDASTDALGVAQTNVDRLGCAHLVELVSEGVESLQTRPTLELLVANLPYVSEAEWEGLEPEIREYEPREALVAGPTGLEAIEMLVRGSPGSIRRHRRSSSRSGPTRPRPSRSWCGVGLRDRGDSTRPGRDRPGGRRAVTEVVSVEGDGAEAARRALERCVGDGGVAIFPADTLYGLACDPLNAAAVERIHAIKGRDDGKPSAVMYFSPLAMRELVSGLGPRTRDAVGALLPGPVTLVVANPERRYPLACREEPERLGVRLIEGPLAGAMTPIFQTSANRSGEPPPTRFDQIDDQILAAVDLAIDAGELIGAPSTVVDVSGIEDEGDWTILREGALAEDEVARALS